MALKFTRYFVYNTTYAPTVTCAILPLYHKSNFPMLLLHCCIHTYIRCVGIILLRIQPALNRFYPYNSFDIMPYGKRFRSRFHFQIKSSLTSYKYTTDLVIIVKGNGLFIAYIRILQFNALSSRGHYAIDLNIIMLLYIHYTL